MLLQRLEIAEMQKQFKVANISAAREKRYGVTVDDGPRIVINQCSCDIQTKHFGYRGVGCRQNRKPILVVMRIARQDVHGAMLEQPFASSGGLPLPRIQSRRRRLIAQDSLLRSIPAPARSCCRIGFRSG